jgi:hypothetical protein
LEQVNRAAIAEQVERRVEHIVHGMRFLKLHVRTLVPCCEMAAHISWHRSIRPRRLRRRPSLPNRWRPSSRRRADRGSRTLSPSPSCNCCCPSSRCARLRCTEHCALICSHRGPQPKSTTRSGLAQCK